MAAPRGEERPSLSLYLQPPARLSPMGHFNGIGGRIIWKATSSTETTTILVFLVFGGPWPVPLAKVAGLRHGIQAYMIYLAIYLDGHGTDGAVSGIAGFVLCGCQRDDKLERPG